MKPIKDRLKIFILFLSFVATAPALANSKLLMRPDSKELKVGGSSQGVVYLERLPEVENDTPWLFNIQTGFGSIDGLRLQNSYYDFDYSKEETSLWSVGASWEVIPFRSNGQLGFKAGVGYATAHSSIDLVSSEASHLRLHLIPVSVGAVYLADFHPMLKVFTPALELGGGYQFYTQRGDTDGSEVAGGMRFLQTSLGLRHSLAWTGAAGFKLTADYRTAFTPDSEAEFSSKSVAVGISAKM